MDNQLQQFLAFQQAMNTMRTASATPEVSAQRRNELIAKHIVSSEGRRRLAASIN